MSYLTAYSTDERLRCFTHTATTDTFTWAIRKFFQVQNGSTQDPLYFYFHHKQNLPDRLLLDTIRSISDRVFDDITLSSKDISEVIVVLPLKIDTLKSTLVKICSLIADGGYFLFVFSGNGSNNDDPSDRIRSFMKKKLPEIMFFETQLKERHLITILSQKPVKVDTNDKNLNEVAVSLLEKKDDPANKWIPYFEWTQYNGPWDLTVHALKLLPSSASLKVLDAGCGAGPDTVAIIQNFTSSSVTGVDYVKEAGDYTNKRLRPEDQRNRFNFVCSDLDKYDYQKDWDFIVCRNVLSFMPKELAIAVLKTMINSLKTGGLIATTFFAEGCEIEGTKSIFTPEEVRELLRDLNILEFRELDFTEMRKTPPQKQHFIEILAQKEL